jgi:hypothetical protein
MERNNGIEHSTKLTCFVTLRADMFAREEVLFLCISVEKGERALVRDVMSALG